MNIDISKIWPGWIITERLGHGGFGHVYKAICESTQAVAAVKVIPITISDEDIADHRAMGKSDREILELLREDAEWYMNEIKVMQQLKGSANIVNIEDSALCEKEGSIAFDLFIRMEYLTSLHQHLAEISPITEEDVIKLGCDICSALEICHKTTVNKRQIIHRDIKPENILYHELSDSYKLGDFGIARERSESTSTLTINKGTQRFIAPEVEYTGKYDHTVDLYSLGLVLYYLCNNERLPFESQKEEVTEVTIHIAKGKRLRGIEPLPVPVNASTALAKVILKACAHAPRDRYASATAMKEALLKILQSPDKTASRTQTTQNTTSTAAASAAQPKNEVSKKKNKAPRWVFIITFIISLYLFGVPEMLKDIFIGEDTSAYEDISDTDPETLAEPVDVLMIENEEPAVDAINAASVVPPEEALPETTAETEPSGEEYTVDTAPVEVVETFPVEEKIYDIYEISGPLTVCGGNSKDTAYLIAPEIGYTNEGMPIHTEEWYKFKTSSNSSAYIFSGINDGSMWPVYFTVYSDDMTEVASDSFYTGYDTTGLVLSPDTEYWMHIENGRSCTYTFSITEQMLDGGLSRTEAYPIELNTPYDKIIEIPGLPDWYKFVTTDNLAVYRFSIDKKISESVISGNVTLTIYDTDGIKVYEFSHISSDKTGYLDIYLNPGTEYYLKINGENDQYDIGDYRFSVSEQICDAGITREAALILEYGERYTGQINSAMSDWYQIEVPDTADYVFKLHNIDTGADVNYRVYMNSSNSYLFSSNASNEDSSTRYFSANQGDILYIEVYSESFAANGTYIFEILLRE